MAAVVTGASFAAGDVDAKKKKKKKAKAAAPSCRALGEACQSDASCCGPQSQTHLACQFVGATGARRCECTTGFTACGGVCVSITCPGGAQLDFTTCQCVCPTGTERCGGNCLALCPTGQSRNTTTCACECPSGQVLCNGQCVAACTGGAVLNSSCVCVCPSGTEECGGNCLAPCPTGHTRQADCSCGCPSGQVFCNGCCHDPATACAGLHNQNFNAKCCSCENPGQPSGQCKNPPLTCPA